VAGFVSGTSIATLSGLAAARFRQLQRLGWDVNQQGSYIEFSEQRDGLLYTPSVDIFIKARNQALEI
jgi:hypothetical protein|tara:strand:- start:474 stop:674 length:201 start_codon:yes stop_codon:yes gene_type:complete